MYNFLSSLSGIDNSQNMERLELNNLRKQVSKLKMKVN